MGTLTARVLLDSCQAQLPGLGRSVLSVPLPEPDSPYYAARANAARIDITAVSCESTHGPLQRQKHACEEVPAMRLSGRVSCCSSFVGKSHRKSERLQSS